jgi:Sulfotransferase family
MLLYVKAGRRAIAAGGLSRAALGALDDRMVFVFGCPRSGTTFLAGAIGSAPGFVDLGEVHPLKSAVPELATLPVDVAAARVRRMLALTRRLGLVGSRRGVEQTPETAFILPVVARAFPRAQLIHLVRDGREVVCSLLERGWLSRGRDGADDVGTGFGAHARFWVEPGREEEFAAASDARRAAWAWRRHVSAVRASGVPCQELRYEEVVTSPERTAQRLGGLIGAPADTFAGGLRAAHTGSLGRHRTLLSSEQLAEVEDEAGSELAAFGYLRPST